MIWICRPPISLIFSFSVSSRMMMVASATSRPLDHDTYTGHYRLRLIEFTPTRLAFEIVRKH
jgi:hypothetical protein